MSQRTCAGCDYWHVGEEPAPRLGLCRIQPPQLIHYSLDAAPLSHEPLWPETAADDWCGHFRKAVRSTASGDDRPGAAELEISDNGIITVYCYDGETFELSALEGLSETAIEIIQRMKWLPAGDSS